MGDLDDAGGSVPGYAQRLVIVLHRSLPLRATAPFYAGRVRRKCPPPPYFFAGCGGSAERASVRLLVLGPALLLLLHPPLVLRALEEEVTDPGGGESDHYDADHERRARTRRPTASGRPSRGGSRNSARVTGFERTAKASLRILSCKGIGILAQGLAPALIGLLDGALRCIGARDAKEVVVRAHDRLLLDRPVIAET
jgi:hypothetical protein